MKKRNKRGKKKMGIAGIAVGVILCVIGFVIVYFSIGYSRTGAEFSRLTESVKPENSGTGAVFTEEDIAGLPEPVQRYFHTCGYIGTPIMSSMRIAFQDVDFMLDGRKIKIDYTQYNVADEPARIAYIDSSLYGIPFEGLDSYVGGQGSMKGVLAKTFTLFHQTGENMDRASLVTFLSECLFLPSAALQDYITWEAMDALHAKATLTCYGQTVTGVFTFDDSGRMLSFTTDDREATSMDGTSQKVRWSAVIGGYAEQNGLLLPTVLQAIWHYDTGDLVYFDGRDVAFEYDPA